MTPDALAAMSPEQKRVAIATACGWVNKPRPDSGNPCWYHEGEFVATKADQLPDYLADLNAMHAAVESLELEDQWIWQSWLLKLCAQTDLPFSNATAAQRCDAFLLTINRHPTSRQNER